MPRIGRRGVRSLRRGCGSCLASVAGGRVRGLRLSSLMRPCGRVAAGAQSRLPRLTARRLSQTLREARDPGRDRPGKGDRPPAAGAACCTHSEDAPTDVGAKNKESIFLRKMVLLGRIELPASPLPRVRSTTELQQHMSPREGSRGGGGRYWQTWRISQPPLEPRGKIGESLRHGKQKRQNEPRRTPRCETSREPAPPQGPGTRNPRIG